jgi:hypothetical protein
MSNTNEHSPTMSEMDQIKHIRDSINNLNSVVILLSGNVEHRVILDGDKLETLRLNRTYDTPVVYLSKIFFTGSEFPSAIGAYIQELSSACGYSEYEKYTNALICTITELVYKRSTLDQLIGKWELLRAKTIEDQLKRNQSSTLIHALNNYSKNELISMLLRLDRDAVTNYIDLNIQSDNFV